MEYTIDLDKVRLHKDKVRLRKDKVESIVYSYLKDEYVNMIVKVECNTLSYSWKGVNEFNFIIDVDHAHGIHDWSVSLYNRKIKKEVSNLCRYLLSGHESFGSVSFNSVIHAFPHP